MTLSPAAEAHLTTAAWPGNVRALRNALERAAILADDTTLTPDLFAMAPATTAAKPTGPATLEALERQAIINTLDRFGGHRKNAAEALGIGLRTLYDKLKRYGID